MRSLVKPTATLELSDSHGQVVATTEPRWLTLNGELDLLDPAGNRMGAFSTQFFSLVESDAFWLEVELELPLVLGFLASEIEVRRGKRSGLAQAEAEVALVESGFGLVWAVIRGIFSFVE